MPQGIGLVLFRVTAPRDRVLHRPHDVRVSVCPKIAEPATKVSAPAAAISAMFVRLHAPVDFQANGLARAVDAFATRRSLSSAEE
jgi:hypothetical protein